MSERVLLCFNKESMFSLIFFIGLKICLQVLRIFFFSKVKKKNLFPGFIFLTPAYKFVKFVLQKFSCEQKLHQ